MVEKDPHEKRMENDRIAAAIPRRRKKRLIIMERLAGVGIQRLQGKCAEQDLRNAEFTDFTQKQQKEPKPVNVFQ